jgi:hypothetical protein
MTNPATTAPSAADFDRLQARCAADGVDAMLDELAASLAARRRWHAVFDVRLMQARVALGLAPTGDIGPLPPDQRERLDERSLAACREVGWPLLEEGHVAAAWMYLRAAAEPAQVSAKLAELAAGFQDGPDGDDEEAQRRLHDLVGIALWEGVDPALGIRLVIRTQGTCNSITAYEQAVSRLPATRQQAAAAVLVEHLHHELCMNLAADLERRGIPLPAAHATAPSIVALLDAAGGLSGDPSVHVDVSHLQSVLRIARVCTDEPTIRRCHELACYGCRLPEDVTYPGEPPFENVAEASRLFYGAQLGSDVAAAIGFFRAEALKARIEEAGTLPADTLVVLLRRLGRSAEALHAAVERPAGEGMPSTMPASGMLPSLVELATAAGDFEPLRRVCRERGDEITFAATLAAECARDG